MRETDGEEAATYLSRSPPGAAEEEPAFSPPDFDERTLATERRTNIYID